MRDRREARPGEQMLQVAQKEMDEVGQMLLANPASNRMRLDAVLRLKNVLRSLETLSGKEVAGKEDVKRRLEDGAELLKRRLSTPVHNTVAIRVCESPTDNPLVVPPPQHTTCMRKRAPGGCVVGYCDRQAQRVAAHPSGCGLPVQLLPMRDPPAVLARKQQRAAASYSRRVKGFADLHATLDQSHFGVHPMLQHPPDMLDVVVLPGDTPVATETIVVTQAREARSATNGTGAARAGSDADTRSASPQSTAPAHTSGSPLKTPTGQPTAQVTDPVSTALETKAPASTAARSKTAQKPSGEVAPGQAEPVQHAPAAAPMAGAAGGVLPVSTPKTRVSDDAVRDTRPAWAGSSSPPTAVVEKVKLPDGVWEKIKQTSSVSVDKGDDVSRMERMRSVQAAFHAEAVRRGVVMDKGATSGVTKQGIVFTTTIDERSGELVLTTDLPPNKLKTKLSTPSEAPLVGARAGDRTPAAVMPTPEALQPTTKPASVPLKGEPNVLDAKTKVEMMCYVVLSVVFSAPIYVVWLWMDAYVFPRWWGREETWLD